MILKAVGDRGVLAELGNSIDEATNRRVMELNRKVLSSKTEGIIETVPAFSSLLVYYNPLITDYEQVSKYLLALQEVEEKEETDSGKLIEIPVCYGGIYGPDLSFVSEHTGLREDEVVHIHSGRDYRIYMLGFLPGFPYLGGMDPRINAPRLSVPRTVIPAGSVGIGGEQTGIYPMDSPGGWQLIGRTPLRLFELQMREEKLYKAGDSIRFVPIDQKEFDEISRTQEMR